MKCCVCGKETECEVYSSLCGGFSAAYCKDCAVAGKESYKALVSYIACAGQFPEDINEEYQALVREQLKLHNVSEEWFIQDVKEEIKSLSELDILGFRREN